MAAPLGNKNGAKQQRLFGDALRRVLTQSPEKVEALARKLIGWAEEGQQWAFHEMLDRLDGKPHQSVDVGFTDARSAEEFSDDELAHLATGSGARAAVSTRGPKEPTTIQ